MSRSSDIPDFLRLDGVPQPTPPDHAAPSFLELPVRSAKPRRTGITHVLDRGMSPRELESLLATAHHHVDHIKLGWGTAYVTGAILDKIAICRDAGVTVAPGGTLLEIALHQDRLEAYVAWLHKLGIDHVEVSNGSLPISAPEKRRVIERLALEFTVFAEVGSKAGGAARPDAWVQEMLADLEAGACAVIAEGRESGTVGLYHPDGRVREPLVSALVARVPADRIIFEAPSPSQQKWFVRHLGVDVNLGNIATDEVIALETLRRGLRADTAGLALRRHGSAPESSGGASGTC
jgi:phosphosulfolactate synthase